MTRTRLRVLRGTTLIFESGNNLYSKVEQYCIDVQAYFQHFDC